MGKIPSSQWWFGGVSLASGCCELREWDQQRSDRLGAMVLMYSIPLAVLDSRTALAGEYLPSAGVTPPKKMMTPPKITIFADTHGRGSIPAIDLVVHTGCGQLWHCVASSGGLWAVTLTDVTKVFTAGIRIAASASTATGAERAMRYVLSRVCVRSSL